MPIEMTDRATQVLDEFHTSSVVSSLRHAAENGNVPRTTLQHRARGRRSLLEKAQSQQYLRPSGETALVRFLVHQDALGQPVRVKHVRSIAFSLACSRVVADRPSKPPGKNWSQSFCKRHPNVLKAGKSSAMDWNRFDIYEKVVQWFDAIAGVLQNPEVLPENVYNMDETGVMLSKLNSVRVIMDKTNRHGCRGARVKRTTVTAVECVSADGRYLHPMIMWPAATHRANWVTHPTPGWHYAYSDSGYTDSYLSLQWLRLVFEPQTRERAGQRPRVLICDGFGTHETLEILESALQHQIILCRLHSHSSHKLQPCDISIFDPLKAAYRDQVERLERGGVGTIGKEHFAMLYCHARQIVFTPRNIRAGWAKAGLFPFCPERVLRDLPRSAAPPIMAELVNGDPAGQQGASIRTRSIPSVPSTPMIPVTPVTPVDLVGILTLHDMIRYDAQGLDSGSQRRLQKRVQELSKAAETSLAEHVLLERRNEFLQRSNSEARVRRSTRSKVIGTARVISYKDLEKARNERALRDARPIVKRKSRTQAVDNNATDDPSDVVPTSTDSLRGRGRYTESRSEGQEGYRPPTARIW
jgi:hypothetical protein